MMLAEIDLAKNQKETALAKVRAIKDTNYTEAFVKLWTIRMLAKLDHLPEAREQLMEFVKAHPENLTGWLMDLALTESSGGKIDPDVTVALLKETPNVTNQHFVTGQIELSAGNLDSAGKEFDQALSTGKLNESDWRTIIDFLRWRKANNLESVVDRAREAFPSALWLNPPPNS
jgi:tetratricopeptide (TPR) repeat protein